MTRNFVKTLILSATVFTCQIGGTAQAFHHYDHHTVSHDHYNITAPHTKTVKFDGGVWYYAKKVSFTVRGQDCHRDTTFDVYVNRSHKMGYRLQRCQVNEDRTYTVNVGQTAKAITFRVRSGEILLKKVVVYGRPHRDWDECLHHDPCPDNHPIPIPPAPGSIMNPPTNVITKYARKIVNITMALRPLTPYEEYGDYVLPIKLHAGKVIPLSRARGVFSDEFKNGVELLIAQIDNAEEHFEDAATVDRQYELIVDLREMRHALAREFF